MQYLLKRTLGTKENDERNEIKTLTVVNVRAKKEKSKRSAFF